jgi:hypothetical protein
MADESFFSDPNWMPFGSLQKGEVEDGCASSDPYRCAVGAKDRHRPEAGPFFYLDFSDDAD